MSTTSRYGYNPNPKQPNTFNAVILDTANDDGGIHSKFKQPAGARLARAALALVYGTGVTVAAGPSVKSVVALLPKGGGDGTATITLNNAGAGIAMHTDGRRGFEVLLPSNNTWVSVPVASHTADTVTVGSIPSTATRLRYLWYANACGIAALYACPVYVTVSPLQGGLSGEEDFLPLGPFVADLLLRGD